MPDPKRPAAPAPVPDPSVASPQGRAAGALAGLLEEIAACRADIVRKEAVARELERRLRTDLLGLEDQWISLRVQTFRALGRRLREGSLGRKAHRTLAQALGALADELESEYGADLRTDRRIYLGEDAGDPDGDASEPGPRVRRNARTPPAQGGAPGAGPDSGESPGDIPEEDAADPDAAGYGTSAGGSGGPRGGEGGEGPSARNGKGGRKRLGSNAARRRESKDQALAGDIRALYLILARALHPDKEANPALREAKTVWMQKVTDAYSRKDLAMLLDILARNPLEAVGPYLAEAPLKTVQGFAKRLRRELAALRIQAARTEAWLHPSLARFLKDGAIDEARYARHLGELKRLVRLAKQRLEAYRTPEGALQFIEGLRVHDWRDLI